MKGATYGSLFTGIGGLDMALESCGITPLWQVEVDPFCNSVLERHWPDVRRYTDIRGIDWAGVERPDIVFGGFPCQPFSVAGQNRGADDERNMWPETYRAIRELRPRYVFLENVPGVLAHGYFGTILGDLAKGGYDAVWDTFTAAEVGAPHRRERLFILAYAEGGGSDAIQFSRQLYGSKQAGYILADAGQQHKQLQQRLHGAEPAGKSTQVADAEGAGYEGLRRSECRAERPGPANYRFPPGPDDQDAWARVLAELPEASPALCRVAYGTPDRTHRLKALGNAVVPAQGAWAFQKLWQRMMP